LSLSDPMPPDFQFPEHYFRFGVIAGRLRLRNQYSFGQVSIVIQKKLLFFAQ
jgi:hypothetical protein